jgi:hypothetical protein
VIDQVLILKVLLLHLLNVPDPVIKSLKNKTLLSINKAKKVKNHINNHPYINNTCNKDLEVI